MYAVLVYVFSVGKRIRRVRRNHHASKLELNCRFLKASKWSMFQFFSCESRLVPPIFSVVMFVYLMYMCMKAGFVCEKECEKE